MRFDEYFVGYKKWRERAESQTDVSNEMEKAGSEGDRKPIETEADNFKRRYSFGRS